MPTTEKLVMLPCGGGEGAGSEEVVQCQPPLSLLFLFLHMEASQVTSLWAFTVR